MKEFTDKIRGDLQADIPTDAVHQKPGKGSASYVKGWWVIDQANQILGADGWSCETISTSIEFGPEKVTKKKRDGEEYEAWLVVYKAHVRVTAGGVTRDGTACGSGDGAHLPDVMHNAVGEAETDALKRALKSLGRRLGLALYDSEQRYVSEELDPRQVHYGQHKGAPIGKAKSEWLTGYLSKLPADCPPEHKAAVEAEIKRRIAAESEAA